MGGVISILDLDSYELHVISLMPSVSGIVTVGQTALRACPALRAGFGCYCLLALHARCWHQVSHTVGEAH
jgi:hypothetical protein